MRWQCMLFWISVLRTIDNHHEFGQNLSWKPIKWKIMFICGFLGEASGGSSWKGNNGMEGTAVAAAAQRPAWLQGWKSQLCSLTSTASAPGPSGGHAFLWEIWKSRFWVNIRLGQHTETFPVMNLDQHIALRLAQETAEIIAKYDRMRRYKNWTVGRCWLSGLTKSWIDLFFYKVTADSFYRLSL